MKDHLTTNRLLLGLLGLVMLAGGLTVLAAGADLYRHWDLSPPGSWPLTGPGNVLVPVADQTRWIGEGWWWPTVIAGLAVLTALAVWWLLSQGRWGRARRLGVGGGRSAEGVEDRVLDDALTADLAALPGVRSASARLTGPPSRVRARVALTLAPGASPAPVLDGTDAAADRLRRSAGWDALPVRARLRVARHGKHRAV